MAKHCEICGKEPNKAAKRTFSNKQIVEDNGASQKETCSLVSQKRASVISKIIDKIKRILFRKKNI